MNGDIDNSPMLNADPPPPIAIGYTCTLGLAYLGKNWLVK